jgi:hypothetical protein
MAQIVHDDGSVERTDGGTTTVVERSGGGAGVLIGIVLLIAVLIGGYFLLNQSKNDDLKTSAITGAAHDVGSAAKKAGDAVDPNK